MDSNLKVGCTAPALFYPWLNLAPYGYFKIDQLCPLSLPFIMYITATHDVTMYVIVIAPRNR
jgi:hypothetical protein